MAVVTRKRKKGRRREKKKVDAAGDNVGMHKREREQGTQEGY